MKHTSVKAIAISVLSIVCSFALYNCGENSIAENPVTESSVITEAVSETAAAEPTNTDLITEQYGQIDLEGFEFRILAPGDEGHFYVPCGVTCNEIWQEEENGDIMNDSIYKRNLRTENLLNMKIVPIFENDTGKIRDYIKKSVTSDSDDYDAVFNRMDFLGDSMLAGYLANLKDISTLDVENPWWDQNIVENFTLPNGKLYFIAGDINFFDDYAAECVFFNKAICNQNDLDYPYVSVIANTWTIDEFYTMAKAAERDVNGDGKLVMGEDVVGHIEVNDIIKHWIYAFGEKSITIDNGDISLNILSERQINVIDKLYDLMVEKQMSYMDMYADSCAMFMNGGCLFYSSMINGLNNMRSMTDEFGILPMPKYDAEQENYCEYVSNGTTTAYSIPITVKDADTIGTVLDVMCGLSTDTVRTAIYDVMLSNKLVRDEYSVDMLEIIFNSKSYDWAVDFSWGSSFQTLYNGIYENRTNNYVSNAEKNQAKINNEINKTFTKLAGLES